MPDVDNLTLYNAVRAVPKEAQKIIGGGRLKGMTDINPMWRIKTLTEQFGQAGIGWTITDVRYWTEDCAATGERTVQCSLSLNVKGSVTPIYGVGGSLLIVKESSGLRLDDEAYKKAYTDAISVACKALGIGADVYWSADSTKYTQGDRNASQSAPRPEQAHSPAPAQAPAQSANKATVTKSATVPQNPKTVKMTQVMKMLDINQTEFMYLRSKAIRQGICPDKLSKDMTDEEFNTLCDAVVKLHAEEVAGATVG